MGLSSDIKHTIDEELANSTNQLKEMIAKLLDLEIQELNLQKVHDLLLKKDEVE